MLFTKVDTKANTDLELIEVKVRIKYGQKG